MRDQLNVDLEDSDLLSEVELSVALMIAGTESAGHLSRDEIDVLLGVTPVASRNGLVPSPRAAVGRRRSQARGDERSQA